MTTPQTGDFVRYRRAEPRPFHRDPETPAFDWVDDYHHTDTQHAD